VEHEYPSSNSNLPIPFRNGYYNFGPPFHYFEDSSMFFPYYRADDERMIIDDKIWGKYEIKDWPGDEVLLEMLDNPLVKRTAHIEQLTLPTRFTTIPNTSFFSRWEHIWGSVAFVRGIIEKTPELQELSDREKLILQLRTFVSDLGHTAYSHLGDWIMQGFGGPEDAHDQELKRLLEYSGIDELLARHGIDVDEVAFPNTIDWIESPSPNLCVDRVDYGVREINRWLTPHTNHHFLNAGNFTIRNGELVMTSKQAAAYFAKAFALLPTEHWGEPVHRLQLELLQQLVKYSIVDDYNVVKMPINIQPQHPRDKLYAVDMDFNVDHGLADPFIWTVVPIMDQIAQQQRTMYAQRRIPQLQSVFSDFKEYDFPRPGQPIDYGFNSWYPVHAPNVEIIPVINQEEVADFGRLDHALDFFLPAPKLRGVDPKYINKRGGISRISETDPHVKKLLTQQQAVLSQAYVARVLIAPDYKRLVLEGQQKIADEWPRAMRQPRLNAEEFRVYIEEVTRFKSYLLIGHQMLRGYNLKLESEENEPYEIQF
jgi:hypothetical protein